MGLLRRLLRRNKPILVHHVSFAANGLGATIALFHDGERYRWLWNYDPGVDPDSLIHMGLVSKAITQIEKRMGLPLTFPALDDSPKTQQDMEEERALRAADDEIAAATGDPFAKVRVWRRTGTPIESPERLEADKIYVVSGSLAVYKRSFVGHRWEGADLDEDEPGEYGNWYVFDSGESDEWRLSREHFLRRPNQIDYPVTEIRAPEEEVIAVFEEIRRRHTRFDE